MKRSSLLLLLILFLTSGVRAGGNDILFTIDGDGVKVSEFEYIYNKNNFNNKADYSESSLKEYLDLYINFRLKVREAEAMGLDKDPKLMSELKVYQEQLYNSFFDRQIMKDLVDEALERSEFDVAISHIYTTAPKGADLETEAAAQSKIMEAYNHLQSGISYADVAKEYSEDKLTSAESGYLGFFSALQIAFYPIENAAYTTEVGSYSFPLRSDIGYHIIKVDKKRETWGERKVAIIKISKEKHTADEASDLVNSVYTQLVNGESFESLVEAYSEDDITRKRKGEMDWFGISVFDKRFEEAAFGLANPGDFSNPVETNSGWYIIKLIEKRFPADTDEYRELLSKRIKQSDRYESRRKEHVKAVLDKFGFAVIQPAFNQFRDTAISHLDKMNFNFGEFTEPADICTITGRNFTDKDLAAYITKNSLKYRRLGNAEKFNNLFEDFKDEKATDFHILEYANENPEYGALMTEYRDGILLFDLMEKKVWSKAVQDSVGLKKYFDEHASDFMTTETAVVRKFKVADSKSADFLIKALEINPDLSDVSWISKLNKKGISTSFEELHVEKTDSMKDRFGWKPGNYTWTGDGNSIVYSVREIIPPRRKTFDEARGFAIAAYQEYLEKQWLKDLREKYVVSIDQSVLKSLIKK